MNRPATITQDHPIFPDRDVTTVLRAARQCGVPAADVFVGREVIRIDLRTTAFRPSIYFFTDGEFIKIGFSTNWQQRLSGLQTANPRELTVLAVYPGSHAEEFSLHEHFAACRVRPGNEWFRDCEAIRDYIAANKERCLLS